MKTAIVILNYNDTATTLSYLKAIQGYEVYDHIVVVDNASTDPSTAEIQACCREIGADFVQSPQNRGYASGNNLGIRYAIERYGSKIIFVSNPDIICSQETAAAVVNAFSEHERIGIASGLIHIYDANHTPRVFSAFAYKTPRIKDMFLDSFLISTKIRRKLDRSIYYDPAQIRRDGFKYVEAISGCFFAISQEAFLAVDGLDEDTFLYFEEAILGQRLKAKGYRGVVVDVPVIHDEKTDKAVGFKKQWRTHRFTQASARTYMRKYLQCNSLTIAAYSFVSVIGFFEKYALSLVMR